MAFLGFKRTEEFKKDIETIIVQQGFGQLNGFLPAQELPSLWYAALLGVFYAFLLKVYLLAVTDKYFVILRLDAMNNVAESKAFSFTDISIVRFSKGLFYAKIVLKFPGEQYKAFSIPKLNKQRSITEKDLVFTLTGKSIDQLEQELRSNPVTVPGDREAKIAKYFALGCLSIPIGLIILAIILTAINR